MADEDHQNHLSVKFDAASMHELLYAVGKLKHSFGSLLSLQNQIAKFPLQISQNCEDSFEFGQESNKKLESALAEVLSERFGDLHSCRASMSNPNETQKALTSIHELEEVCKKLDGEMQMMRRTYHSLFMLKKG